MTIWKTLALLGTGTAFLALAACGDEQAATSEPPAPVEQEGTQAAETPDVQEADRLERLREEADRLAGEARERAEQALEDAGPYIDQAAEAAGQIAESVDEIIQRAGDDLERGIEMLEERISEMRGERPVVVGDRDALLLPEDDIEADTSAAARAAQAGVEPAYIGVWADTPGNCGRIDQVPVEMFAVITPSTIRRYESLCNIEAMPLQNGETTLTAACMAEGMEEERQITLQMPSHDELRISYDGMPGGAELVRCHPAE
jgi:hypothetical protein